METFWFGFLAGFLANWLFGMLTRLLPAKWVRYRVRIEKLNRKEEMGWGNWIVTVHIQPPRWKRILMEPLREYLLVQMTFGEDWLPSKWVEGDINTFRLLADGAMSVGALVFSDSNALRYLADDYPQHAFGLVDGSYHMWVRVIRSLDGTVADEVGISVTELDGRVSANIVREAELRK